MRKETEISTRANVTKASELIFQVLRDQQCNFEESFCAIVRVQNHLEILLREERSKIDEMKISEVK